MGILSSNDCSFLLLGCGRVRHRYDASIRLSALALTTKVRFVSRTITSVRTGTIRLSTAQCKRCRDDISRFLLLLDTGLGLVELSCSKTLLCTVANLVNLNFGSQYRPVASLVSSYGPYRIGFYFVFSDFVGWCKGCCCRVRRSCLKMMGRIEMKAESWFLFGSAAHKPKI